MSDLRRTNKLLRVHAMPKEHSLRELERAERQFKETMSAHAPLAEEMFRRANNRDPSANLDMFSFPNITGGHSGSVQWFFPADNGGVAKESFPYVPPRGAMALFIVIVSGGGGGGGACSNAAGTARGGGGGASGSLLKFILPLWAVPSVPFFVRVGPGGTGGAAAATGQTGNAGANTFIYCIQPEATESAICLVIGGLGGVGGSATSGGAGGAASTGSVGSLVVGGLTLQSANFSCGGTAGGAQTGANGTAGTFGSAIIPIMGGTGGGGTPTGNGNFTGGPLNAAGFCPALAGGAAAGGAGQDGLTMYTPHLFGTGGTGGGTNGAAGTGGKGGIGGLASGGGGGGAGVTGGAGGLAGNGFAVIMALSAI